MTEYDNAETQARRISREDPKNHDFLRFLQASIRERSPDWNPPQGTSPWALARIWDTLLELYERGHLYFPDCQPPDPDSVWALLGIVAWASSGQVPSDSLLEIFEIWDSYEVYQGAYG